MNYDTLLFETEGRVAYLTLNRPDRLNAFNETMLDEILDVLERIGRDNDLNVLVVTGAGRAFCSGVDTKSDFFLRAGAGAGADRNGGAAFTLALFSQHRLIKALAGLPQLTIAAVNGVCVGGGGFGMALACDIRIAAEEALFWMIPAQVAVIQDYGITWFLSRLIGTARTLEILLTGERIDGSRAAAMGFVNRCVPAARLREETTQLAQKIAAGAPLATKLAKASVYRGLSLSLAEQLDTEAVANGLCTAMQDAHEGFAAYAEKRTPEFKGR